jgi:hypothetical protein
MKSILSLFMFAILCNTSFAQINCEFFGNEFSINTSDIKIRILAIKHTNDSNGASDCKQVLKAADEAKAKGLKITSLGYSHADNLNNFRSILQEKIKSKSSYEDTLFLFTVGHGSRSGVEKLGKRIEILKVIAEEATKSKQRILWWQLSCHAAGGIPDFKTLPKKQQDMMSSLATSTTDQVSYFDTEAKIISQVFSGILDKSMDYDKDKKITAGEIRRFLSERTSKSGSLFYAARTSQVIFGESTLARSLPISNHSSQMQFSKEYILVPN